MRVVFGFVLGALLGGAVGALAAGWSLIIPNREEPSQAAGDGSQHRYTDPVADPHGRVSVGAHTSLITIPSEAVAMMALIEPGQWGNLVALIERECRR